MKTMSAALKAHYASEATTLATLWRVTRTDGVVMGFTDHDTDIVYGGVTYQASTGYTQSAIRGSVGLSVDNLEVKGLLDSTRITEDDLIAGVYDYAAIKISRVNWADLSMGEDVLQIGTVGESKVSGQIFATELRGLTQALSQNILEIYQPGCRANLFDARCMVNPAAHTVTGSTTSLNATNPRRFIMDSARAEGSGYFSGGKITFTSGENLNLSMEVAAYTAGQIELALAMPRAVAIGDTYSLTRGCNKSFDTCKNTFGNVINFRGEPHLPGMDQILQVGGN